MNTAQYLRSGVVLSNEEKTNAEQTFLECQEEILTTVNSLIRRYGGDFEDMMDEATCVFLAALSTYDNSIPFNSWLRNWVRWELIDTLRVRLTRSSRYDKSEVLDNLKSSYRDWTTKDFIENLSDDAAYALTMIFDGPEEFQKTIEKKGAQPRNYRSTLREYLYAAGWSHQRVLNTFSEIKFALMDS